MNNKWKLMNGCGQNTGELSRDWCVGGLTDCLELQLKMLSEPARGVEATSDRQVDTTAFTLPSYAVAPEGMAPSGAFV